MFEIVTNVVREIDLHSIGKETQIIFYVYFINKQMQIQRFPVVQFVSCREIICIVALCLLGVS